VSVDRVQISPGRAFPMFLGSWAGSGYGFIQRGAGACQRVYDMFMKYLRAGPTWASLGVIIRLKGKSECPLHPPKFFVTVFVVLSL
jgi:hypothetical protein